MRDSDKAATPRDATTSGDGIAFAPMHVLAEQLRTGGTSASALLDLYLQRIRK